MVWDGDLSVRRLESILSDFRLLSVLSNLLMWYSENIYLERKIRCRKRVQPSGSDLAYVRVHWACSVVLASYNQKPISIEQNHATYTYEVSQY